MSEVKYTPLYTWHLAHNAKMASFAGYQMPMWYASVKQEHLAVINHAGLFDTNHMAVLTVQGSDAFYLLQQCFTQNLAACIGPRRMPLTPGRCVYGAFLNIKGHVLDDAIVFMLAENDYMVVVNAGMGDIVARHLTDNIGGWQVSITDWTDQVGKIDLQGPASVAILHQTLETPDQVFDTMPYFSFKGHFDAASSTVRFQNGTAAMISRTGYTGEIGFEIFCAPDHIMDLWQLLLNTGEPLGLMPCGLAARDSLRAGAVLPLSHQDIGNWPFLNHPWSFALPYNTDRSSFTKDFIGCQALLNNQDTIYTYAFAGYDPRKVTADKAVVLDKQEQVIGTVLTCTTDMAVGRSNGSIFSLTSPDRPQDCKCQGLSCGFIKVEQPLEYGQKVQLQDNRRIINVQILQQIRPARTARRPLKDFINGSNIDQTLYMCKSNKIPPSVYGPQTIAAP